MHTSEWEKKTEIVLKYLCFFSAAQGEERECAFTDQLPQWEVKRVAEGEGWVSPENTTIRCAKGKHCFGLWEKTPAGELQLVKQGKTVSPLTGFFLYCCSLVSLGCLKSPNKCQCQATLTSFMKFFQLNIRWKNVTLETSKKYKSG